MKKNIKVISINTKIFIVFILILLGTSIFNAHIPYSNWWKLIEQTSINTLNTLNKEIINEIDVFIKDAKLLNTMNKGLIEKNIIDISDEAIREGFFVDALSSFDSESIYGFNYSNLDGECYGARKNEDSVIEIMKNNEDTNGHICHYSQVDGRSGELLLDSGKIDPRTSAWYKVAEQEKKAMFSPVYKDFVFDKLTVSFSIPIYSKDDGFQGVLGSHINLSRIDKYLEDLVQSENACAIIVEKDSGNIIANCSAESIISKVENSKIERLSIDEISSKVMPKAYKEYMESGIDTYKMDSKKGPAHIKIMEYQDNGLEWLIITSLPESIMLSDVKDSIKIGTVLTFLVILISSYVFLRAMKKYMYPIKSLIQTQEEFAKGNLLKREKIIRNDEIGMVAGSFNAMADTIYNLINNLEKEVIERTQELKKSKDYLETTLLSIGDGFISTDEQGLITFMNPAIERITGWSGQKAYGKPIQEILTIIYEPTQSAKENPIIKVLESGGKIESSGQPILISKNKEAIPVEYIISPIKSKEDNVIGAVMVLRDITDRKEKSDRIKHLSMYDQLTGLYNRWHMEDEIVRLDKQDNLPLAVMVIDVNGLKLVNDAFGHDMGDKLLQIVGRVLKNELRSEDIVGRVGGDEFLILLPKVNLEGAELVKQRILKAISLEKLESVIISIAIGYTVKENPYEDIETIRIFADNQMYKNKLVNGKTMRSETIETVLRNINFKYDQEQIHTERVSQYCKSIGRAMGLSEDRIEDLKIAGVLHDIGKTVIPPELLNKTEKLTDKEFELIKRHSETGYHILKSVDEYVRLAEDVLYHHENWDGTGYPQGLKGDEIPLNSRIIAVADAFEAMTAQRPYQKTKSKDEAIIELKRCAGSQFDPEIVKVFVEDVLG